MSQGAEGGDMLTIVGGNVLVDSFKFATSSDDVGMATGATIHTANGLNLIVSRRDCRKGAANDSPRQQASTASK